MSDLKPCKACKHPCSETAKSCPNCGKINPTVDSKEMAQGCAGFIILATATIIGLSFCASEKQSLSVDEIYRLETTTSITAEQWLNTAHETRRDTALFYYYSNSSQRDKDELLARPKQEILTKTKALEECVTDGVRTGKFKTSGLGFESCFSSI